MKSQFNIRKTYEEVADFLRDQIIGGVYKPGERLPSLRELGHMLGVGQSTIREAIGSLKTMGLVTIRQGEGTFVTRFEPEELLSTLESIRPVTKQDIISLLEVRKIIETGNVRLAAQRRTLEDLEAIGEALGEMEEGLTDPEIGAKADWKLHYAIARASHNEILESVIHSISETVDRTARALRKKLYKMPGIPEKILKEHRVIYEYILFQNADEAEKAMMNHLLGVEKIMLEGQDETNTAKE